MWSGNSNHLLLSNWLGIKEGLLWRLSKTPPTLMRPLSIELCDAVEFIERRPMESFNDAIIRYVKARCHAFVRL
jgi:hypothetical protein